MSQNGSVRVVDTKRAEPDRGYYHRLLHAAHELDAARDERRALELMRLWAKGGVADRLRLARAVVRELPALLYALVEQFEMRWRCARCSKPPTGLYVVVHSDDGFHDGFYDGNGVWKRRRMTSVFGTVPSPAEEYVALDRVTSWRFADGCAARPWHEDHWRCRQGR